MHSHTHSGTHGAQAESVRRQRRIPRPRVDGWALRFLSLPIAMGGAAGFALVVGWLGASAQTATLVFGPAFLVLWLALYRMA